MKKLFYLCSGKSSAGVRYKITWICIFKKKLLLCNSSFLGLQIAFKVWIPPLPPPPRPVLLTSLHVRKSRFQNQGNFCLWNPEYWALQSGTHLKDSGIPLKIGMTRTGILSALNMEPTPWNPDIQDCLGFPYMVRPTEKDRFNLSRLLFDYVIFSIKITEVIKPDPVDNDEDKKLITWCQELIKGFVQLLLYHFNCL